MKPINDSRAFFKGAFILAAGALITKILSAIYRVPFQNIVGDVGFYIYQQVYPIYGMMLILAAQGFPVVISKLYNEAGDKQKALRMLVVSFITLAIVGLSLFFLFYFGADWIAHTMGDPKLSRLLQMIAFPFLILPFTSVWRGYFQGEGNMIPTAFSQVGEQLVRVTTILILSAYFVSSGYSLYTAGTGAVFGSVTGGLIGLVILCFFFLKSNAFRMLKGFRLHSMVGDFFPVVKALLIQGLAISISSMVLILMQLADALNLYSLLVATGMTEEEAKVAKGVFDRGQPLIQLGTVVATSLALTLVPAIAGKKQVIHDVRTALEVGLVVGAGAAMGLFSIIEPTNLMLFTNKEGSDLLALLSLVILPGSILISIVAVLQGLGHSIFPASIILGGFGLKYVLNIYLIPDNGTKGAAWATILSIAIVFIILMMKLRMVVNQSILSISFILRVLFASGVMSLFLYIYLKLTDMINFAPMSERLGASFQALTAVLFGAVLYVVLVIKMRLLKEHVLHVLPFGSKLLFLLPKR